MKGLCLYVGPGNYFIIGGNVQKLYFEPTVFIKRECKIEIYEDFLLTVGPKYYF